MGNVFIPNGTWNETRLVQKKLLLAPIEQRRCAEGLVSCRPGLPSFANLIFVPTKWPKISVTQRGATKGGHKQMRANANKRRQTLTNASKRREAKTQANASKREQTWTNANKRLHPPFFCGFLHPPLQSPYKTDAPRSARNSWQVCVCLVCQNYMFFRIPTLSGTLRGTLSHSAAKGVRQKVWQISAEKSDRSVRKSDQKVTESVPKTKKVIELLLPTSFVAP